MESPVPLDRWSLSVLARKMYVLIVLAFFEKFVRNSVHMFLEGEESRVLESSLFCFLSGVRACRVLLRRKPSQFWAESVECV